MAIDPRVLERLERWEACRAAGEEPGPEVICRDCPELLEDFKRAIRDLGEVDGFLSPPRTLTQIGAGAAPRVLAPARPSGARFQHLRFHAEGGLGVVYLAHDADLEREVAIKYLKVERAHDPVSRQRFHEEARLTARLDHPSVVSVLGSVEDESARPGYAMRFIRGETLHAAIQRFHEGREKGSEKEGREARGEGRASGGREREKEREARDDGPETKDEGPAPGFSNKYSRSLTPRPTPLATRLLQLRELLDRFIAVCNAVAYAHSRGVLHCDIKPGNIMLGRYGETMILDWGLARTFAGSGPVLGAGITEAPPGAARGPDARSEPDTSLTRQRKGKGGSCGSSPVLGAGAAHPSLGAAGEDGLAAPSKPNTSLTGKRRSGGGPSSSPAADANNGAAPPEPADRKVGGTPGYMSPEQVKGAELGPASDIYSLGATLYSLLTGRSPHAPHPSPLFPGLWPLTRSRRSPLAPGPPGPSPLIAVCAKAMAHRPEDRYASAEALAEDVKRWLADEPVSAWREPWPTRLRRWGRRHRPWVAGATALLLALTAALGIGLVAIRVEHRRTQAALADVEEEQRRTNAALAAEAEQRERADLNYRAARATMQLMLERLDARARAGAPHFAELHLELLKETLPFDEAILQRADSSDPGARIDAALSLTVAAAIEGNLGRRQEAREHVERAIALLEGAKTTTAYRMIANERYDRTKILADCYTILGELAAAAGRTQERDQAFRRARPLLERFLAENPDDSFSQGRLAYNLFELGKRDYDASQWAAAENQFIRALALYGRLAAAQPQNIEVRLNQAGVSLALGWFYKERHRFDEAGALFAEADKLLGPPAEAHPDETRYALILANARNCRADLLLETGQPDAAGKLAGRTVELLEAVRRRRPAIDVTYLRVAHWKRALAWQALGRWADAAKDWDRVMELGGDLSHRQQRAKALTRAGEHNRALAEFHVLTNDPAINAEDLWALALECSQSALAAWHNLQLSNTDRVQLSERYASQAMALLDTLRSRGFFRISDHIQGLRSDPALYGLRGRPDFQRLLGDVEASLRAAK